MSPFAPRKRRRAAREEIGSQNGDDDGGKRDIKPRATANSSEVTGPGDCKGIPQIVAPSTISQYHKGVCTESFDCL